MARNLRLALQGVLIQLRPGISVCQWQTHQLIPSRFCSTVPGIVKLHRNMFSSRLMNYFWQKMLVFCIGFYFLGLYCKTFYGGIGNDIQNRSLLQKCLRMFHILISLNQHNLSQALMYILITFCKLHSICEICNYL